MESVSCVGEDGRLPHLQLKCYKSIFESCTKPPNSTVIVGWSGSTSPDPISSLCVCLVIKVQFTRSYKGRSPNDPKILKTT